MNDPHALTARQADVLLFILGRVCEHQRPPTLTQIAAEFGFASPKEAAHGHLRRLRDKGWLSWSEDDACTLRVAGARWKVAPGGRLTLSFADDEQGWRLAGLVGKITGAATREQAAAHFAHLEAP